MPLDYLYKDEFIEFPAIGTTKERPVGAQMRPPYFAGYFASGKVYILYLKGRGQNKNKYFKRTQFHMIHVPPLKSVLTKVQLFFQRGIPLLM